MRRSAFALEWDGGLPPGWKPQGVPTDDEPLDGREMLLRSDVAEYPWPGYPGESTTRWVSRLIAALEIAEDGEDDEMDVPDDFEGRGLNGEPLTISDGLEVDAVVALRLAGYSVLRNDPLIDAAFAYRS
jgi:hypothetical protein